MFGVKPSEAGHFGVGIFHKVDVAHKPAVAVGIGVEHHLVGLLAKHKVFGVEHVEHGRYAVAFNLAHVALCIVHSIDELLQLVVELAVDKVLIAVQFGCVVAANAVVVV